MSNSKTLPTKFKRRWISTRSVRQWDDATQRYALVEDEGYWYEGPVALAHPNPNSILDAWRVYDSSATQVAAQDTDDVQLEVDTDYQVCFRLEESNGDAEAASPYKLEYNKNSTGWADVTASSSNVQATTAGLTDDGTYTPDRLTGATGSRINGYEETSGTTPTITLAGSSYFEVIFGITIVSGDVVDTDSIDLKVTRNGTDPDAFTVNPTVVVNEASPTAVTLVADSFTLTDGTLSVFAEVEKRVTLVADSFTLSDGTLSITQSSGTAIDLVADSFTLSDGTLTIVAENETRVTLVPDSFTLNDGTLTVNAETAVGLIADSFVLTDGTLGITAETETRITLVADSFVLTDGTLAITIGSAVAITPIADSFTLSDGTLTVTAETESRITLVPDSFSLAAGALTVTGTEAAVDEAVVYTGGWFNEHEGRKPAKPAEDAPEPAPPRPQVRQTGVSAAEGTKYQAFDYAALLAEQARLQDQAQRAREIDTELRILLNLSVVAARMAQLEEQDMVYIIAMLAA